MILAFHTPQIDVRGTCIALYDYAKYNEDYLCNKSIIVSCVKNKHDMIAVKKFSNRFPVYFYDTSENLHDILIDKKCDILYAIKYGEKDDIVFDDIKTVVHCVFDLSQPHGKVYGAVSKTLADKYNYPLYVPHMIGLKPSITRDNLRCKYGIPEDAKVFGRYGGLDTFDLEFCRDVIKDIVRKNKRIFFLFMNTPKFDVHPQIIFVEPTVDMLEKNRFICTCDAHIECGSLGHSFGLSMGEFSVNNKPIISYKGNVWNTAHYDILGDRAIYFQDKDSFEKVILDFDPANYSNKDMNCYKEYSPKNVMDIFKKVFID
jgi:hypothetical protein